MKGNRDMFYGNYQMGGYKEPMYIPPEGYNMSGSYMSYGPNVMPGVMNNGNMQNANMQNNNVQNNNTYIDEYDTRITKLERQVRRLDQRLRKLENAGTILEKDSSVDSNLYMI